jgi:RNA polymerase sigma-70 factor (ECF subfamily)
MNNGYALVQATKPKARAAAPKGVEEDLLRRIAAGDETAMRTLYARCNVQIYRYVRSILHDASKAEDVVSEVFFDVWRQANSFKGRSRVSTWLIAIARFKALSLLRKRWDESLDDEVTESIEDEADGPDVALQKKDDSILLRMCLKRLSPKHREIIDLVYYQEMSVGEVAAIVGVPRNTVKTRMFYARKSIARLMEQARGQRVYS